MSVSTTANRISYVGDGVTTVFTFPYLFLANSDIVAYLDGVPTAVSVAGAGGSSGGPVTFGAAPAVGVAVELVRNNDLLQSTDLSANDPFPADSVERMSDKAMLAVQRAWDRAGRSLRLADGVSSSASMELSGDPAQYPGYYYGVGASGQLTFLLAPAGTAGALAGDLASTVDALKGGGMSGHAANLVYGYGTVSKAINARGVSITDYPYNAVCDGTTDDTAAILAALAAHKHVIVPANCTPLISSTVAIPVGKKLEFLGGLGNALNQYPASYFIKKSTMTTVAITVAERACIEGGGLVCQGGNTGDGLQIIGNSAKVSDFLVHGAGGDGVRVGTAGGANCNSFKLTHVVSQYNGGKGFYIHDAKLNVGADANAGTLTQCFAQHNTGDGFTMGHCFWVTLLNCLSEINTGWGLQTMGTDDGLGVPQCRYLTVIGGDYNEGNTAGQLKDEGYFSTFHNPDPANVPTNAAGALAGSGRRNNISSQGGTSFTGLGVKTLNDATYAATIDDATGANMSYPLVIKKTTGAGNGQGAGIRFKLDVGAGYLDAGGFRVAQYTGGKYGVAISVFKAAASLDALEIDPNAMGVYPSQDNAWLCGVSGKAWSGGYTQVAFTVVSDRNVKQDIAELTANERLVAQDLRALVRTFRFKDAVRDKGAEARTHVGCIAQDVRDAFLARNLDPERYAMFCRDTFEADGEQVTRLGLRYEELLAFVIAAL